MLVWTAPLMQSRYLNQFEVCRELTRDFCLCFEGVIAWGQSDDCRRGGFNNCGSNKERRSGQTGGNMTCWTLFLIFASIFWPHMGNISGHFSGERGKFTRHARTAGAGGSLVGSGRRLWTLHLVDRDDHISTTAKKLTGCCYCIKKRYNVLPAALFLKEKEIRWVLKRRIHMIPHRGFRIKKC